VSFGEDFLREPRGFFETCSETPCGESEEVLVAAGGSYRCRGLSPEQAFSLRQNYPTADGDSSQLVDFHFCKTAPDEFLPLAQSGWEYTFDSEPQHDEVLLAGLGFAARIRLLPQFTATMWTPHTQGKDFESAFANVFRVIVGYALVQGGGALLHSAAVAENGSARIFVGVSGAGKSTVSRLALESGRSVLSDDLNALWPGDGSAIVEQVPFTGELRGSRSTKGRFPVAGIFRLRQGRTAGLRPLTAAETVALLFGCAPFINSDPFRRERLLANLEACTADVPAEELTFPRDGGFWHLVSTEKAS